MNELIEGGGGSSSARDTYQLSVPNSRMATLSSIHQVRQLEATWDSKYDGIYMLQEGKLVNGRPGFIKLQDDTDSVQLEDTCLLYDMSYHEKGGDASGGNSGGNSNQGKWGLATTQSQLCLQTGTGYQRSSSFHGYLEQVRTTAKTREVE